MKKAYLRNLKDENCRFCSFVLKNEGADINSPWLKGIGYFSIVSLGSLVHGWSLVMPDEHVFNLKEHYKRDEFWQFVLEAEGYIKKEYGDCVYFEHGSTAKGSITSCGTAHAHLHIVPLSFDFLDKVKKFDSEKEWVKCTVSEIESVVGNNEYLFFFDCLDGLSTTGYINILKAGESQFFRKLIADHLGVPEKYDYNNYEMLDIGIESLHSLISCKEALLEKEHKEAVE